MKQYYFAYGMNTNLGSMAHRCPTATCLGAATLPGYRFQFRYHADVELDIDCQVEGVLWEVDDDNIAELDILEGFPRYYLRQRVWVNHPQVGWVISWVYTMTEQDYITAPAASYLHMCREGYRQNDVDTHQIEEALILTESSLDYDLAFQRR